LRPYLNKVVFPEFDGVCTTEMLPIRADPTVIDTRFLFGLLLSPSFVTWASRNVAGANLPRLSPAMLEDCKLCLPPLDEQRRIGLLLTESRKLRRVSEFALDLSKKISTSTFVELFGDPGDALRRWPNAQLEALGSLDRGRSQHRPRDAAHLYGGPYPFIQTGDVANAEGYVREHRQTYSDLGLTQSKLWPGGTLCITIAANIAKTAILTYPACFPDSVVGFIPSEDVSIHFVQAWLGFLQETLERTAPEVAQKNINLEILRALRCPVPDHALQRRFDQMSLCQERLRMLQREGLRQTDLLFNASIRDAFAILS
jgi:type I restriction enzyme S subunit